MKIKKLTSFLLFICITMFFCVVHANFNESMASCNVNFSKYEKPAESPHKCLSSTISPSDFDPSTSQSVTSEFRTVTLANKILGMIQAVGSIASVATLVIIGIKYMLGSADEKAEYKSSLIPYIVGAILVFSASNIVSIVYKIMTT